MIDISGTPEPEEIMLEVCKGLHDVSYIWSMGWVDSLSFGLVKFLQIETHACEEKESSVIKKRSKNLPRW